MHPSTKTLVLVVLAVVLAIALAYSRNAFGL
jgi:hypothetical protein